jgi:ABC-type branched-subunit amino acid transport system substrate-binding protein
MPAVTGKLAAASLALALIAASTSIASAQKKYDTGATDTEIKVGNIMPYSGPASAYGIIGRTEAAYFKKINEEGGINGRKINFVSYDDAYSPPKAVEQARKLVESDEVLFIFNSLGTPSNSAIQKYMNSKKVPQILVATGATKWNDPQNFPWTMGWQPSYQSETQIYAKWLLKNKPDAKIAVLFQNDDYGKDYLKGLKDGLGAKAASMIVAEESYETSEPTIDSHIVRLKSTGANVFMNITTPKFAAQAIKKVAEIGWKPVHYLVAVAASVGAVMRPAGIENGQGIITSQFLKDVTDPKWDNDDDVKQWRAFMAKWNPTANVLEGSNASSYAAVHGLTQVLKQCGDELTRENVMRQAANIKDLEVPLLLPGVKVNTSPTNFYPLRSLRMAKFEGDHWVLFGDLMTRGDA